MKNTSDSSDHPVTNQPYANLVGCLQVVGLNTRPDILFIANYLGQHLACPSLKHWSSTKRMLKYLKGIADFGLVYQRQFSTDSTPSLSLLGYTDTDWASSHLSMQSTSGNCFFINDCLVS